MDKESRSEKDTTVWTRKVEVRKTQLYEKKGGFEKEKHNCMDKDCRGEKDSMVWTRKVEVRRTLYGRGR